MKRRHLAFHPRFPTPAVIADLSDPNADPDAASVQRAFDAISSVTGGWEFARRITPPVDVSCKRRNPLAQIFGTLAKGYAKLGVRPSNPRDRQRLAEMGLLVPNAKTPEGKERVRKLNHAFLIAALKQQTLLPPLQIERLSRC